MKYPKWFPYPSCWYKPAILCLPLSLVRYPVRGLFRFGVVIEISFLPDLIKNFLLIFIVELIIFLCIGGLAYTYQALWGNPPKNKSSWVLSWQSIGEAFWFLFVLLAAVLIVAFMFLESRDLFLEHLNSHLSISESLRTELESRYAFLGGATFVTMAYLYHLRLLILDVIPSRKKK